MTQATRCFGIVVPLIVLMRLILAESAATTLYVSRSGASLPPYTNWTSAAHDIAQALSASSDGDLILVAPGAYPISNTLSITKAVTILSTQGPTNTVINGSYQFPCIYLSNTLAVLEGFTVRGGYAESRYGGGLFLAKGSVNRCLIYNNVSDRGGGGVYAETSDSRVDNSAIYDNDVFIPSSYGSPTAIGGGGVVIVNGAMIRGSTICNNSMVTGGFMWPQPSGGGVLINRSSDYWYPPYSYSTSLVENCIVYFNYAQGVVNNIDQQQNYIIIIVYPPLDFYPYSPYLIRGTCSTPLPTGLGNIDAHPHFESLASRDYRLREDSPCIDAGVLPTAPFPTNDLSGGPRVVPSAMDMGAYERTGLSCRFQPSRRLIRLPEPGEVVFSAIISGLHTNGITYHWDYNNDGVMDVESDSATVVTGVFVQVGTYTVSLWVSNDAGETASYTLANAVRVGPSAVFVSTNSIPLWPYTNRNEAARTIQEALYAAISGTIINIDAGRHSVTGTICLSDAVHLVGAGIDNTAIFREGAFSGPLIASSGTASRLAFVTLDGSYPTGATVVAGQGGCARLYGAMIESSRIQGGRADEGGGLYLGAGSIARNCIVVSNRASANGGGIYLAEGSLLESSTILDNIAVGRGGGIYLASTGTVLNSIIWNNIAAQGENYYGTSNSSGIYYTVAMPLPPGLGNIGVNPEIEPSGVAIPGLLPGSPAISAGIAQVWMAAAADAAGNSRILGNGLDLGAREFDPSEPAINLTPSLTEALAPAEISLYLHVTGYPTNGSIVEWDLDGNALPDLIRTNCFDLTVTYNRPTVLSPRVTVRFTNHLVVTHMEQALALIGAGVMYVSPGGNHQFPYTNWVTAATNLLSPLDVSVDGSFIHIGPGVYTMTQEARIVKSMQIGGAGSTQVVLQGTSTNAAGRVLRISHSNAVVSGVQIRNGYAEGPTPLNNGGGVYIEAGTLRDSVVVSSATADGCGGGIYMEQGVIDHCAVQNNLANGFDNGRGGGIAMEGGLVRDSIVSCNGAAYYGGGLYVIQSGGVVRTSIVSDNRSGYYGGGLYLASGGMIDTTIIRKNFSHYSGAVKVQSGELRNCAIIENTGEQGVYLQDGIVKNCVISRNLSLGSDSLRAGLFLSWSSKVINSIIAGNLPSYAPDLISDGVVEYSCSPSLTFTNGNISYDPLFINSDAGDYRLQKNSPCIDTGTNEAWMTAATDLEGNPRIRNPFVDMGCYESLESSPDIDGDGLATADERLRRGTVWYLYDSDFDGMPDGDEVRAGSDPGNPRSFLGVQQFSVNSKDATGNGCLTWQSVPGRSYSIQRATNMVFANPFETLFSDIVAVSNKTSQTVPVGEYSVFRVLVNE